MEAWAHEHGCFRVELTSADALEDAHAFWRAAGYHRTALRFTRMIAR
jgi:hypothetical protein